MMGNVQKGQDGRPPELNAHALLVQCLNGPRGSRKIRCDFVRQAEAEAEASAGYHGLSRLTLTEFLSCLVRI